MITGHDITPVRLLGAGLALSSTGGRWIRCDLEVLDPSIGDVGAVIRVKCRRTYPNKKVQDSAYAFLYVPKLDCFFKVTSYKKNVNPPTAMFIEPFLKDGVRIDNDEYMYEDYVTYLNGMMNGV